MSKHFFRISNSQYTNLSPLPNAHADGDRVEQCFAELGYTPHSRRDLDAAGMRQFLEDFSKITASDQCNMAVFYYSGHGTHDVTTYLIPTNVRIGNASDVALNCINYQSILTSLVPSGCPVVLVLDCCRTSTLPASFSINHAGLTAPTEHVFTLFACAEQNPAYDGFQGDDRGPVARFLDEAFQSGRRTNVRETLFFVRGQVKALTGQADANRRKFIHLQEPQIVDPEGLAAQWDWEGRYHGGLRRPPLIRDWRAAAPHVQTRIDAGDLGLLQYYNEVTKFIETEQQLIDFDEFVNDPARIGFLLLTGESGIGKSRFCSTMCQRYQNANRVTGFLNHLNPNAKGFDWSYWVAERDYILIVDDCNEREELAARMITALQAASMNDQRRIRIVLSDRDIAGDIRDAIAAFVPTRAGVTYSVRSMRCDPLAPNGALQLYMDALEYLAPRRFKWVA